MNKRALFLSVAITTFLLVIVGGVFSVYRAFANSTDTIAQAPSANQLVIPSSPAAAMVPAVTQVTPEQAAAIAARYLGRQDVYAVENALLDSVAVYKVIFSSGDIVYVGLDGQILRVENPHLSISEGSSHASSLPIITGHEDNEHETDGHDLEGDD